MRFGSWVFPISQNSKNDGNVIDDTLIEIEKWESLGFDAIWLSEHHFDGATAYADPVVFAAAIAQRTKHVRIGFGRNGFASSCPPGSTGVITGPSE